MPRPRKQKQQDVFAQVRQQARKALSRLDDDIRRTEHELRRLVAQAALWRDAVSGMASGARRLLTGGGAKPGAPAGTRRSGKRVDWDEVLRSVPPKFTVADIMKHPGARAKGRNQVYPALTRWQQAKKIKKIGKGSYQRVG